VKIKIVSAGEPIEMKTNKSLPKPLILAASVLVWCGLNLHAQPVITNQPASQTNLPGTAVSFSVGVNGTGPITYQWRFNGTNLPNIITTVAGTKGNKNSAGDGGAAIYAGIGYPFGVAFDAIGNLFITEPYNNYIRKVDTNGIITTVAGNGYYSQEGSYSGDGGAATNASLDGPIGMTFDAAGNLYIADCDNSRIRKVDTNGIITTVAGNGSAIYAGDGGAATNASLDYPHGVAFDAFGNLFIADSINSRIRKVDTNGIITTVAGNGSATYAGDGGAATNASLYYPSGVTLDASGNLFIADSFNNCIRKVDTNGNINTMVRPYLGSPRGVAFDAFRNLFIADTWNARILKLATNGIITLVAGNGNETYAGDGGAATNASLNYPVGVACDAAGNLFIADNENNCIRAVNFSTNPTFKLNSVSLTNAGNYTVVISNHWGSVTSAVATLTVTIPRTPPQIIASGTNFGFAANQFGFNISGAFGQTIVVDGSTNLVDWTPLFTNTAGNSPFYFFDPAATNFPWRFYRARLP
jgi:trimeric autotransporter adhesin